MRICNQGSLEEQNEKKKYYHKYLKSKFLLMNKREIENEKKNKIK